MFNQLENFKKTSETLKQAALAENDRSAMTETILFILTFIAMMIITALVTFIITRGVDPKSDTYVLLSLGTFIIPIIISILAITKIEKRSLRSIGFTRDNIMPSLIKGIIIGAGMFISIVLIGMLLGQYSFNGINFSSLYLAIPYMIVYIIQPFAEEIYTRGWIIPLFSKNYSVFIGIVVSTLFFVSMHMGNNGFNLIAITNLILFGILFSLLFLKVDNIWICGGLHSAWNFIQGYLLGFNVSGIDASSFLMFSQTSYNIINGSSFGPESGLIATAVILLILIIVWKYDI